MRSLVPCVNFILPAPPIVCLYPLVLLLSIGDLQRRGDLFTLLFVVGVSFPRLLAIYGNFIVIFEAVYLKEFFDYGCTHNVTQLLQVSRGDLVRKCLH